MVKKTFKIKGMHCNSCSSLIEDSLKTRVNSIKASYSKGTVEIDFDESKITEKEIQDIINAKGYECTLDLNEDLVKKKKTILQKILVR